MEKNIRSLFCGKNKVGNIVTFISGVFEHRQRRAIAYSNEKNMY